MTTQRDNLQMPPVSAPGPHHHDIQSGKHKREKKKHASSDEEHSDSDDDGSDTDSDSSSSDSSSEDEKKSDDNVSSDSESDKGKKKKKRGKKHSLSFKKSTKALIDINTNASSGGDYASMAKRDTHSMLNTELVELPSISHLQEIFEKCQAFTLSKIQPDHLKSPYVSNTSDNKIASTSGNNDASDDESDSPIDIINKTLEKNIRNLFSDEDDSVKKFNIDKIKTSLIEYVKLKTNSNHPNMAGSARKSSEMKQLKAKVFEQVKNEMPIFYMHLLNAMKGLIVYVSQNTPKQEMVEKEYEKHCYGAWKEVISYLKTLQMVISSAIKAGFLESKFYQTTIDDIMAERDSNLKKMNNEMDERRRKIIETERALQSRDEKIREISEHFSAQEKQKADLESSLLTLRSQINLFNDPVQIAKYNIKLMKQQDQE